MCVAREMPKYQSHKVVHALKIKELVNTVDGGVALVPEDEGYASFPLEFEYLQKHKPCAGGYYVVYADGYKSFSPAKAFEEGYTKL